MKRFAWICRAALVIAGGLLSQPLRAIEEKGHPAKPLLWKIEGNGLEKPSYLFGTIHVSTPAIANLHPAAEKAFVSADAVYTEIPMDADSQLKMMPLLLRKDGKTLTESIGKELSAELDAELKLINPQLDATPFQPLQTWAVTMALPLLKYQLQGAKAVDQIISERAIKEGKEVRALETVEEQMGLLGGFKEEENIIILRESLRQMKEDRANGIDGIEVMLGAYAAGDDGKLEKEIDRMNQSIAESEHKELGTRFIKKLFEDRNLSMAATIGGFLGKEGGKVHFFAAGSGHFIGKDNIRDHLARKGYRITRIED
ncbi:TraB/GumN family protein [Luteolibacter sp. SL250]|uniref:TraB/GumN family protein n=1 Tax=Luteolibacter sp. SL250 TaxID=2995170 RepID=UPI00226E348F|nr:TraB/GumN family protein [Luteolibacter sp. SL250]WAC19830.1 TraB/GumN family protein [Luteolibacter sp. SL250]